MSADRNVPLPRNCRIRIQPEGSDGYIEIRYDSDAIRVLEFDGQEYETISESYFGDDPDEES
jgi:hypothetical protein